jgi:hypothetical protein
VWAVTEDGATDRARMHAHRFAARRRQLRDLLRGLDEKLLNIFLKTNFAHNTVSAVWLL